MRVTFLESSAGLRLTKTITATETKSYPDVKNVTSHEESLPIDANWADTFGKLIKDHGTKGHCLLKGPLKKQLVAESRAGFGDRTSYSDLLVLDIDDLPVPPVVHGAAPYTATDIIRMADFILSGILPRDITRSLDYVVQASSSLGRKHGRISFHIFIALTVPLPPKSIKLWLRHVNQTNDIFTEHMSLSSTGQSLKYPLDPSVADNTKLIFISAPDFSNPNLDPFVTPSDRIAVVKRGTPSLDLAAELSGINPEKVFSDGNAQKDKLRDSAGLKKRKPNMTSVNIGGENLEVITNPDKMSIAVVNDSSLPYVRCNINGGDSGAYYFNVNDPMYMFNFKDEPIFSIEAADADFYQSIFEKYCNAPDAPGAVRPLRPVVLRDYDTDTLYNAVYDPNSCTFTDDYPLTPTSSGAIEGFMRSHGQAPPAYIPEAKVVFDPPKGDQKPNLEVAPYYVNMYQVSPVMREAVAPRVSLDYETAKDLRTSCPRICTLVSHMLGNGEVEFQHFINWLAFIYQTRSKTMTAWVLGGVPGTGKGAFVNKILRPLFGQQHVTMKSLENIEEQFNSFMRTSMFLVVDEFRMADANGKTGSTRIADKLKNQITEPMLTIRSMRSNQIELPSYTNFIFLTNRQDAIKIEPGDRRYNVAPRQEEKLVVAHPHLVANLDTIHEEIRNFAGALETFKVDAHKARTCLENDSKSNMRSVSMTVFDEFCDGLLKGKMEGFIDLLDITITNTFEASAIVAAQTYIKTWIASALDGQPTVATPEHIRTVYNVLSGNTNSFPPRQFAKMLSRNNVESKAHRLPGVNSKVVRGVRIEWKMLEQTLKEYVEDYFKPEDQGLLKKKTA